MTDRDPRTAQSELWMSRITPSRAADLSNDEEKHRQPLHSSKLPEWPTLTERTSVLGIRILLFIHRHCGALPFRIVLRMVNAVYWLTSPRLRAVVCDYQRRVDQAAPFLLKYFGTSAPSARSGLAQLERFSLAILEKFCALSREDHLAALDVSGDEPFRKDAPKAGCVILTSHTGCQELLSQASPAYSSHPIVILQHTGHARRFNELLERAGARPPQVELFEIGAALSPALVMELADRASQGAYIVLAGDRTPMGSEASQAVPFFGSPARFPTGGALLADLLGLPLRMMVCTRPKAKERRYRVKFFELAAAGRIPRKARAEHLQNMAARYAMHLEEELKSSPLDWANYYDFWESLS